MGVDEGVAPADDEVVQPGIDRIEAGNLLATLGDQYFHDDLHEFEHTRQFRK
jgi:hypothetical protein